MEDPFPFNISKYLSETEVPELSNGKRTQQMTSTPIFSFCYWKEELYVKYSVKYYRNNEFGTIPLQKKSHTCCKILFFYPVLGYSFSHSVLIQ